MAGEGYAKLVFPDTERIITHLTTVLGRQVCYRGCAFLSCLPGDNKQLSRSHAKIEWRAGKWFISCQHKNGLRVDDQRVAFNEDRELKHRSLLTIGQTELFFLLPVDAVAVA